MYSVERLDYYILIIEHNLNATKFVSALIKIKLMLFNKRTSHIAQPTEELTMGIEC